MTYGWGWSVLLVVQVTVRILTVDADKKQVALTMKTEAEASAPRPKRGKRQEKAEAADEEEEEDAADTDVLKDAPVGEKDVSAFENFDPKKMLDGQVSSRTAGLVGDRHKERGCRGCVSDVLLLVWWSVHGCRWCRLRPTVPSCAWTATTWTGSSPRRT